MDNSPREDASTAPPRLTAPPISSLPSLTLREKILSALDNSSNSALPALPFAPIPASLPRRSVAPRSSFKDLAGSGGFSELASAGGDNSGNSSGNSSASSSPVPSHSPVSHTSTSPPLGNTGPSFVAPSASLPLPLPSPRHSKKGPRSSTYEKNSGPSSQSHRFPQPNIANHLPSFNRSISTPVPDNDKEKDEKGVENRARTSTATATMMEQVVERVSSPSNNNNSNSGSKRSKSPHKPATPREKSGHPSASHHISIMPKLRKGMVRDSVYTFTFCHLTTHHRFFAYS